MKSYEPAVRLLIEHGADLDEESPLIEALRRGHKDVVRLLVEKGADANAMQGLYVNDGESHSGSSLYQLLGSLLRLCSACLIYPTCASTLRRDI